MLRSLKNEEPVDPGRSALKRRLAVARERQEGALAPGSRSRTRGSRRWDPAMAAGISPGLMMAALIFGGVGLALLVFSGVRAAGNTERTEAAETTSADQVYVQPNVEVAAPMAPDPAEAIDDYYILLRQGMYDVAWGRTTTEFQEANYPAGYPGYLQAWSAVGEVEVLASGVVWQNREEASVVAELRDKDADRLFKNAYLLRFDPDRGLWSIVSISSVW